MLPGFRRHTRVLASDLLIYGELLERVYLKWIGVQYHTVRLIRQDHSFGILLLVLSFQYPF